MSSITATRTPRFTPPAAPTRKPTPRRRTLGQGASVVGRADRPCCASSPTTSRRPVVTRVAAVGRAVETRSRVVLDEFFAAEYDGDEQRLEVAAAAPQLAAADPPRPPGRVRSRPRRRCSASASSPPRARWPTTSPSRPASSPSSPARPCGTSPSARLRRRRRARDDGPPRGDQPPRLHDPPGRPAPPRAQLVERVETSHETSARPLRPRPARRAGEDGRQRDPMRRCPPRSRACVLRRSL